jgi:hypothetical protein
MMYGFFDVGLQREEAREVARDVRDERGEARDGRDVVVHGGWDAEPGREGAERRRALRCDGAPVGRASIGIAPARARIALLWRALAVASM